MKDMYVIEKELHEIHNGMTVMLRKTDLYDAESGEWIGCIASNAYEAKLMFWYRNVNGDVRFIVEMKEFDGIVIYEISAADAAWAIARKSVKLLAAIAGWFLAEAAGGVIESIVGMLLGF